MRDDRSLMRGKFVDLRLPVIEYRDFCTAGTVDDLAAPGDRIAFVSEPTSLMPVPYRVYGEHPPKIRWNRAFDVPAMYIAKLQGAVVASRQRLMASGFRGLLIDSFRTYRNISGFLRKESDSTYVIPGLTKIHAYLPGQSFYLDGVHAGHYGHFFMEVFSRLWAASYLEIRSMRFLIWEKNWRPFMLGFLRPFGITGDQIHLFRHAVRCENLIVARQGIALRNYVSPLIGDLWHKVGSHYAGASDHARIYVSRSQVAGRRLVNEEEVEDEVRKHGFTVFHPQHHPFEEQIRMLRGARAIIQPVGSNTYSSLLVDQRPRFLLLCPGDFLRSEDQMLNAIKKEDISYVFGRSAQPDVAPIRAEWRIDMQVLREALADWP